ncbi:terminase [Bordetella genomosp. 9]|uniref:Terminase n=2 Tax=Bordetella genomosp. 9 TaxID=1416803 RepID=A0A261RHB8_9BORD|nr:terminase [Bordetella genomosp. 9]
MNVIRTPEKEFAFLVTLAETGNVTRSAAAIGASRSTVYEWRESDDVFAKEWEKAMRIATLGLEDEARRRAEEGVDEPVFYQGINCGTVRKYSDTLLIFLLKARDPKYREKTAMELTGANGGPVEMNDAQAAGRLAAILAAGQARLEAASDEDSFDDLA